MANCSKKLEDRLLELGEDLASPPSSVDELYSLFDLIDGLLSRVEQSPSQSMLDALQPLMKALALKEFLRHSDMDVRVAVASCISEITRITAPEAPYDDDIMKEIFQMIVEAFEGLNDMSSRSFQKRVSILETVAKVRSCVVMLDLECDALILQMFHHFLKTIRIDHSENVFSSMETIMTLVIEESEDISPELLSVLLDTLKKDNKDVLPIAEKLAEKVLGACATKLKLYLLELVQSKGASFSEYNKVVASICQENAGVFDQDEVHVSGEPMADDSKLSERTVSDELPQEVGRSKKVGTAADTPPTAVTSNGNIQMGNGDSMEQLSPPKKKSERSRRIGQSKNVVSDQTDCGNVESIVVKADNTTDLKKRKGRKTISSVQLTDTTDQIESDKDASVATSRRKGRSRQADSSQVDASGQEGEKKNGLQRLPGSDDPPDDTLAAAISSPPNSSRAKRGRPPGPKATAKCNDVDTAAGPPASASVKKDPLENSQIHEVTPSKGDDFKEPEDTDDVEAPICLTRDSEVKQRSAGKKGRSKRKAAERESSGRKQNSVRKQQKEERAHEKNVDGEANLKEMASLAKSASKVSIVDETRLDGSAKPKSKRKRVLETEEISETPEHKKVLGGDLVGSRIKVWWPDDKMFYEGIVHSYFPGTKEHKIVYTDGDVEVLLLKNERWEYAESDLESNGGKQKAEGSASQMLQNKKARGSSNTTSKQAKSQAQAQSKSGTDSHKDVPGARGRPRSGTSNLRKLSYDDTPDISNKSEAKFSSHDKTPWSSGKLKDEPEKLPEDGIPRTSSKSGNRSKDVTSKPGTAAKGDTSKISGKSKDDSSKPGRKSENETPNVSTKLKVATLEDSSKSGDCAGKSKDATPITSSRSVTDVVGKNKTLRKKPKNNTPETAGEPQANGNSSKGKRKGGENENTSSVPVFDEATAGRKRKRKGRN